MDPYSVLGIDSNQSLEEIKAVYHQLAREYHPDKVDRKNTTEDISNKFLQIQEAWELIKTNHNLPKLFVMAETVKSDELIKIDETLYSFPCRCGEFYEVGAVAFLIPFFLTTSLSLTDLCRRFRTKLQYFSMSRLFVVCLGGGIPNSLNMRL
jgi:curved DNA-binding protein CbpA